MDVGPGRSGIAETQLCLEAIRDLPSCPSVDGVVRALDMPRHPSFCLLFSTGKGLNLKVSVPAPHSHCPCRSLPPYPRPPGRSHPLGHTQAL